MVANTKMSAIDPNNMNIRRAFLNRKMGSDLPIEYLNDNNNDYTKIMTTKNPPTARALAATTAAELQGSNETKTTTTRVKTSLSSTRLRHISSSSSSSSSSHSDVKSSSLSSSKKLNSSAAAELADFHAASSGNFDGFKTKFRTSLDDVVDDDGEDDNSTHSICSREPLITFPDESPPQTAEILANSTVINSNPLITSDGSDTMHYQQKMLNNFKTTKLMKDGYSAEQESSKSSALKSLHSGDLSYAENCESAALRARLEIDGVSAEKGLITAKGTRSLKSSELSQAEVTNMAHSNLKVTSDKFTSEEMALKRQQQRQMVSSSGIYNQQQHHSSSSHHRVFSSTMKTSGTSSTSSSSKLSSLAQAHQYASQLSYDAREQDILNMSFDDLDGISASSSRQDVDAITAKYTNYMAQTIKYLLVQQSTIGSVKILAKCVDMMQRVWTMPYHSRELGCQLCSVLRTEGGLDLLIRNCSFDEHEEDDVVFGSARLLEQCLSTDNLTHIAQHGLDSVVNTACGICSQNPHSVVHSRVGTGILEHLFKHNEKLCSDLIRLRALDTLLFECRKSDVETLRHCAAALANLSLYGGTENQETMIKRKVPMWLFPLAFHHDDIVKYFACLTITVLVANAEIEADVLQSGTLELVEPFVTSHNPSEFAKSNLAYAHGQCKTWLRYLVPVLSSKREEARNLAAFHFCMEAGIKKQQGTTGIFAEIGAIASLKLVASCPNAVASKFAAQALRLIDEEVPHKLSQQVPLWSVEDVAEWVKQIGFAECVPSFIESRVDGDLLLQLSEDNLRDDIGLGNGIKRKRFARELHKLKRMADYSSRDSANINHFLQAMGPEFSIYTYSLLNAGIETKDTLRNVSEEQLLNECNVMNSIHRFRIMDGIRQLECGLSSSTEDSLEKSLDVFISYRRSNGSQLASLLKVHLQLRGFTVFIDVERLEAGKFDSNLLQSIQRAKNFVLVLTPNALERCYGDEERKDWVHREIVTALQSQCNIIPITDDFQWPQVDALPEDMQQVCRFNGVRWIHDYQDACVDKVERFMRGELNSKTGESMMQPMRGVNVKNNVSSGDNSPAAQSNSCGRQPPIYQRLNSNDSGSSSNNSNKGGTSD